MYFSFPDQVPDVIRASVREMGLPDTVAQVWWDEYKERVNERRAIGIERQKKLSKMNAEAGHRPVDGVGQCVFRIDPVLRESIADEFGWEAATSDEFCRELIRDNDWACFVPTVEKKTVVVKTRDLVWVAKANPGRPPWTVKGAGPGAAPVKMLETNQGIAS